MPTNAMAHTAFQILFMAFPDLSVNFLLNFWRAEACGMEPIVNFFVQLWLPAAPWLSWLLA
jgi:hypothetical protein